MLPHDPTPTEAPPLLRLHDPEEVFDWWDAPVLFTVLDEAGALYLGVWSTNPEEGDKEEPGTFFYLYVRMSEERWSLVRSGQIDLHDAFADAEDGRVLREKRCTQWVSVMTWVDIEDLTKDMLPLPGTTLSDDALTTEA